MKNFNLKIFFTFLIVLIFQSCTNHSEFDQNWKQIDNILDTIVEPSFNNVELNIIDFGAKADSTFDSNEAIQNAIDECSKNGGGKVIIPEGNYFSAGSIFLKSNVNLHLQNANINFSTNSQDYLPVVFTRWEGIELYNYSALIYAKDQENIAITGKGILNGNATNEKWWPWKGRTEYGFIDGMPSQLDSLSRPRLLRMNISQAPVEERIFGNGYYLRPNFFQTINCKNILIDGITFKDSPMWFLHPVLSENIIVRNVKVEGHGPNNDGLDPESCKNVLIENCEFNTGDDCIAIKSGRNADGRRINVPSENIIVRNCKMLDGHGGVVIGSEISGGCKNVFVENCEMDSPNLDRAIRIKTNTIRGGVVENIFVRNIKIGEVKEAVLRVNLLYEPKEIGERNFIPKVKNIYLSEIKSNKSERAFYLEGLENSTIDNISISNSALNGVGKENIMNNVKNFSAENVYVNNELYKKLNGDNEMKKLTNLFVFLLTLSFILNAQDQKEFNFFDEVKVSVTNPADVERKDELVSLSVDKLKSRAENFNKEAFIIYLGDKEIPSQLYNDGLNSQIVFACYFKPNQSKEFSIKYLPDGKLKRKYDSRTYAELAMKFDAVYKYDPLDKRNKYTSDHFENFTKVVIPENHTDHDALFKYEGPGWESEKVGYRFYLDWRNATDIFGKTINKLVLDDVGTNDVTAHEDSYHEMQDWGMDIFKVGNTLGIGSIGMMNADSIYMVSKTDEISCEISFNGPILSEVTTNYKGWLVGENKYDLVSKLSISAGSRITNATLKVFDNASNITTGLAKYKGTDFIKSSSTGDWQYIALWGKQTLNDDNLGIVLFYKKSALINQSENDLNYYVELKPIENKVNYGFAAAWEKEPDGIKTKEAFVKYIDEEIIKLNSPLTVDYK